MALALGACNPGMALAQTAAKPVVGSGAQPTAGIAASAASAAKTRVVLDTWVLKGSYRQLDGWHPATKPTLTRESVAELRSISCVADVAARRSDAVVNLRTKDGKAVDTEVWAFDPAGVGARGWKLSVPKTATDAYYVSAPLARRMGLPAKPAGAQTFAPTSLQAAFRMSEAPPDASASKPSAAAASSAEPASTLKLLYGGTFNADLTRLSRHPDELLIRFEPLFPSKNDKWSNLQLVMQEHSIPTFYVRVKPGLAAAAREACRMELDTHMQKWAKALPRTSWMLVPLED